MVKQKRPESPPPKSEPIPYEEEPNEKFDDAVEHMEEGRNTPSPTPSNSQADGSKKKKEGFAKFQKNVLQKIVKGFDSRPGTITIVLLVILDGILGQISLMISLYDPAFPNPLSSNVNAAASLGASDENWGIVRKFFFWTSFAIRTLFLFELTIRLFANNVGTFLKNPYHVLDLVVVILAFFLKPCLSARDSIITSPILLIRLWRLGTVIKGGKEKEHDEFRRMVEDERKTHQAALQNQRAVAMSTQKKLDLAHEKLKMLLGEEAFKKEILGGGMLSVDAGGASRRPSKTSEQIVLSAVKV
ncbi:hypothetical protein HDU97_004586 [Phlyctochytrium planicorne]|nr:hypothetical protein HDU97_004586 [Phlyctochytrium planicorne]